MIEGKGLVKQFGTRRAVDGVSLSVAPGQIFGLLGPNAAGKTTLIRLLCGLLPVDGGSVAIAGQPIARVRQRIGYVSQHFGQYEELTVWENLTFYASLYGITDRAHLTALLETYQLLPYRDAFAGTLSGGYKRRLALACAIAHDPEVVFLDEPTAGIDPLTRKSLWDEFYNLSAAGKTLFVTTHYMEEAERCHTLAFISLGRLVAEGAPAGIRAALKDSQVLACDMSAVAKDRLPGLRDQLSQLPGVQLVNQFGEVFRLVASRHLDAEAVRRHLPEAIRASVTIRVEAPNLEDAFIALTSTPAADAVETPA
jgi:ABC-2 type transport system ATP-binding protein